jgi:hypothetical protein
MIFDFGFNPIGAHAEDTSVSSATTLTAPTGATKLLLQALTKNVRYTLDGTTPTASKGFQLTAGDPPVLIPLKAGQSVILIETEASADIEYQFGN